MAKGLRWVYPPACKTDGLEAVPEGQKRRYVAHFVSKLTDADGLQLVAAGSESEQAETQHWLDTATACGYVPEREQTALLEKCTRGRSNAWNHDGKARKVVQTVQLICLPPSVLRHLSSVI